MKRTCSHGNSWDDYCPRCELVMHYETLRHWEPRLDEARKRIKAIEAQQEQQAGKVIKYGRP